MCPRCGWLSTSAQTCPVDGVELAPCADVVEAAIEAAVAQSADTLAVRHHSDLGPQGRIGAVLRF